MKRARFTEEQIIGVLREHEAGLRRVGTFDNFYRPVAERPDVHSLDRLSVARDPKRPPAEKLRLSTPNLALWGILIVGVVE